jgi:hypothetical protein
MPDDKSRGKTGPFVICHVPWAMPDSGSLLGPPWDAHTIAEPVPDATGAAGHSAAGGHDGPNRAAGSAGASQEESHRPAGPPEESRPDAIGPPFRSGPPSQDAFPNERTATVEWRRDRPAGRCRLGAPRRSGHVVSSRAAEVPRSRVFRPVTTAARRSVPINFCLRSDGRGPMAGPLRRGVAGETWPRGLRAMEGGRSQLICGAAGANGMAAVWGG